MRGREPHARKQEGQQVGEQLGERVAEPAGEPRVVVRRSLPSQPAVRASASLFLTEAERQGVRAGRTMLYVGPEPAPGHVAAGLRVEPGTPVLARRKLLLADEVPVRVATRRGRKRSRSISAPASGWSRSCAPPTQQTTSRSMCWRPSAPPLATSSRSLR
ncbi:hypothetical protein [Microbispora sp. NBC_01389]|uniref:hypothetical protein n=1 Tax=Microbispora sp. NBC_01389 TaxID=2903584 RepID=UPI00324345E7